VISAGDVAWFAGMDRWLKSCLVS